VGSVGVQDLSPNPSSLLVTQSPQGFLEPNSAAGRLLNALCEARFVVDGGCSTAFSVTD